MADTARKKMGRPKTLPADTEDIHVNLPGELVRWGRAHPEGLTVAIREAMRAAMRRDQAAQRRTPKDGQLAFPVS